MRPSLLRAAMLLGASSLLYASSAVLAQPPAGLRPMTFLDVQQMRNMGSPTPSPDGRHVLYTVSTMDWKEGKRQTDIHIVSVADGVSSSRQLTYTTAKDEGSLGWLKDNRSFLFLSNREAPENASGRNQLYLMRFDGGEARRLTDTKDGVADYAVSDDGQWIVYRSGKTGEQQLHRLAVNGLERPAETLTKHPTGITAWQWAPDANRIYYTAPDTTDADDKARREKKFTVDVQNAETPIASLWTLDPSDGKTERLTSDGSYSVGGVEVSPDGKWIAFTGGSTKRYERNITQAGLYSDLYLLEVATRQVERLTDNREVGEGGLSFSPDSRMLAFSAPDDLTQYTMTNRRLYLREVEARGKPFRKLGTRFDGDVSAAFWSPDGKTVYFNEGVKATTQLFALDLASNAVRAVTAEQASLTVSRDDDSGLLLITYSDGSTPPTLFTASSFERLATRATWTQLTDTNPQVRTFALGEQEEVSWKSKDGTMVGGVLVKPVGFTAGVRYPLIVALHGGPAAADVLGFNGGYNSQVYAGAGYVVLRPNYRGSTNYGQAFTNGIVGNYFAPGYEDIMAGVDHLIAQGIVDPGRMGALGWSAGGHWSNWILVSTDRFKAISSGAGTANWISMYAQSDVQRNRQFYLGNKLPYDDFDAYWRQSPLKYIKNAKTPTMIHVVQGDPRVPSPQSIELHMALKQLGIPTELFLYPGSSHGIPDPRNQFVKAVSEMAWMDYYVRGMGKKFAWRDVLSTLDDDGKVRVGGTQ